MKGLTHGFGAKLTISPSVVLSQYRAGNVFYDILERKNAFLDYKNSEFKKWKNCDLFNVANPWFWSKIGHFSTFFFLGNIGQEKVFYDILEQKKNPF